MPLKHKLERPHRIKIKTNVGPDCDLVELVPRDKVALISENSSSLVCATAPAAWRCNPIAGAASVYSAGVQIRERQMNLGS